VREAAPAPSGTPALSEAKPVEPKKKIEDDKAASETK